MLSAENAAWTFSEPNNQYYSTPTRITVHRMHFDYERKARGLDGNVDGNLRRCEIVFGITRNALDGKADFNFNYKTYYFSKAARQPLNAKFFQNATKNGNLIVDIGNWNR